MNVLSFIDFSVFYFVFTCALVVLWYPCIWSIFVQPSIIPEPDSPEKLYANNANDAAKYQGHDGQYATNVSIHSIRNYYKEVKATLRLLEEKVAAKSGTILEMERLANEHKTGWIMLLSATVKSLNKKEMKTRKLTPS